MANSNTILVSVIVPCYNAEHHLVRAVNSVFNQTHTNWELLLVNNNSTDNTANILEQLKRQNPGKNITVLEEQMKGAPAARNRGLINSDGKWIQFLDADDELLPDKLAHQLEIAENKNADFLISPSIIKGLNGSKPFQMIKNINGENAWLSLINSRLGDTCANLWRRSSLIEINGWDINLTSSQEYDLMFRLLKHGCKIWADTSILTIIYKETESISRTKDSEKLKQVINNATGLRLRIKQHLVENGLLDAKLSLAIDKYIYFAWKGNQDKLGKYAGEQLKTLKIKVPLSVRIRLYLSRLKQKLK